MPFEPDKKRRTYGYLRRDEPSTTETCTRLPEVAARPLPSKWAVEALQIQPDSTQIQVLDSASSHLFLCCTRQWGKSLVAAIRAAFNVVHHPGSTTLIAGPSLRQSSRLLHTARTLLQRADIIGRGMPGNPLAVEFPNKARLIAVPNNPDKIRGYTIDFLIVDEAAFLQPEIFQALQPMRAVANGPLWMLSTPKGRAGVFFDLWHDEAIPADRFRVPATDCPRIPAEFLESERRTLGEDAFRQEYLCEFIGDAQAFFDPEDLEAAIDYTIPTLYGGDR